MGTPPPTDRPENITFPHYVAGGKNKALQSTTLVLASFDMCQNRPMQSLLVCYGCFLLALSASRTPDHSFKDRNFKFCGYTT